MEVRDADKPPLEDAGTRVAITPLEEVMFGLPAGCRPCSVLGPFGSGSACRLGLASITSLMGEIGGRR
ncbi:hypothetical protein GCM10009743_65800 [Kribbella swartbergensis]